MQALFITLDFKYILKEPGSQSVFQTANGQWNQYNTFKHLNYDIIENYSPVLNVAQALNSKYHPNYVQVYEPTFEDPIITIKFYGTVDFIETARTQILDKYNHINFKSIDLSEDQVNKINDTFLQKVVEISNESRVEILINQNQLQIFGTHKNIGLVETQIKVMVDAILNGYVIEAINVNLRLIPILGDHGLINFKEIAKQLDANIYLPDLLPEIFNSDNYDNVKDVKIWITASHIDHLLNAKKIIENLVLRLSQQQFYTKTIVISKEKSDLISLLHPKRLLEIISCNGSFISFPNSGTSVNEIVIQSNCIDSIDETIKQINDLCCEIYKVLINSSIAYESTVENIIKKFKLLVKINSNGIEIVGKNTEVKKFLPYIDYGECKSTMTIEIGNDQKEFISGKKNGKILKILNQCGGDFKSIIKFFPLNEYNFLINLELQQSTLNDLMTLIALIENELPFEFKFNIPEIFHKSIIGNGGSIIQSIMKKYNVYIKFSSQTKNISLYGFKRFDNVLIKCPTKNSKNIKMVELELHNLVLNCGNNNLNYNYLNSNTNNSIYNSITFKLLKSHYLLLVNRFKLDNLNNLEIEHSTFIDWPQSIADFDSFTKDIEVKGSDIKMKFFVNQLISMLPKNFKFIIVPNARFIDVINSNEFDKVSNTLKIFYNVEITVIVPSHELWISYFEDTDISLAVNKMTDLLMNNGLVILDKLHFDYKPVQNPIDDIKFKKNKRPLNKITNEI